MICHVVRDHVDLPPVVVSKQLTQEVYECVAIENLNETRMPFGIFADPHRAHYLATLADRGAQYVCSYTDASPSPMNGAGLLENGFILIECYSSILPGFFLI